MISDRFCPTLNEIPLSVLKVNVAKPISVCFQLEKTKILLFH